jgi:hypothetical protein
MALFLTVGYGDQGGYDATAPPVRDAAHQHDAWLIERGSVMGRAGAPIQVRNHGAAGVETAEGPFLRADLPVAGFALIEAADVDEAISLVARSPCAVANGVIEIWPLL